MKNRHKNTLQRATLITAWTGLLLFAFGMKVTKLKPVNGFISPEGQVFNSGYGLHWYQARIICADLGIHAEDPERALERLGWVNIRNEGFFWDRHPNEEQKTAIAGYMLEHHMIAARFNTILFVKGFKRAIDDGTL